jgi:hypothetical protein
MNQTIKELMKHASRKTAPADFSVADVEGVLREEIRKLVGNYNLFQRNKLDLFELIQESIDDVLPNKVAAAMGAFAEVQQFAQGVKPVFKTRLGRRRAKQFITRATPAGTYETFRLDSGSFEVGMDSYGGGVHVDFERYLDGLDNIMDLYEIVIEGLSEKVYELVQNLLLASYSSTRPAANKKAAAYFDADLMVELTQTVAAYGSPVIFCAPQFAATMHNGMQYNIGAAASNGDLAISAIDLQERRTQGYIGVFHGTPVVVLPQSFIDETNTQFVINPRVAYVIPAGKEKIVKIAFEGQTIVDEFKNKGDRSMEIMVYKKMGAAIVTPLNYWGIYENTAISAAGWDQLSS